MFSKISDSRGTGDQNTFFDELLPTLPKSALSIKFNYQHKTTAILTKIFVLSRKHHVY